MTNRRTNRAALLAALGLWLLAVASAPGPTLAADAVSDSNVAEKLATATTAADHEALASYFRDKAAAAGRTAAEHEAMLGHVKAQSGKVYSTFEPHCRRLINAARANREAYEDFADERAKLAKAPAK